jgi:hypothetical protein
MQRLRIRFTIRFVMLTVAAIAVSSAALVAYRNHLRKVEAYCLFLGMAPSIAAGGHFSSAEGYRGILEYRRRAEEYLGISNRRGAKPAPTWTDEDEGSWQRGGIRIIPDPKVADRPSAPLSITSQLERDVKANCDRK